MTGQERPNSHQNEIFWVSTKTLPVLFFILLKCGSINSLVTVCKIYMSGKKSDVMVQKPLDQSETINLCNVLLFSSTLELDCGTYVSKGTIKN